MLELTDLCVHHGPIKAVDGISLRVPAGRIVTLIGSNGAGKTTTLRAISGLHRPKRGAITFEGRDLTRLPSHEIVALGLSHVPEGRLVFGNLSVEENLRMGAYLERDARKIAHELSAVFALFPRLAERRAQLAGTLSGGEQQMLAIGRALMSKPRCLLLDEPSLGIAPLLIRAIFDQIVAINRTHGITILLVEQNARLALEISHDAYVLETGRVVMQGPSATLKEDPQLKAAYLGG